MLPNIVHWFTMEKFRLVHLGNTERRNPNLCLSTGDLTLVKIPIYFNWNQNDRLAVSQVAKSHDFKGNSSSILSF